MTLPKISIITASFNSEKTISDTIESVLNQTYDNIEYLIIDGGSKDQTIAVIKKYESEFNGRLKWISESDKGIYDAWNKGVKLSIGDWIAFVGSDDILLNDAIANYVEVINNHPHLNFISSNALQVMNDLTPIRITGIPWSDLMLTRNCITHVGCLNHRNLFEEKGQFDINYRIAGDYDFLLRCFNIIKPFYLPVITVKIRQGGVSGRQIFAVAKEILKIKIANQSRPVTICYFDYWVMIGKYYFRVNVLNRVSILNLKKNNK